MPYTQETDRKKLDAKIESLVDELRKFAGGEIEGQMNYTISTLLCKAMRPKDGWRYKWINRAVGVLECVKLEFYRRLAAPYELKAISKNGDIEVYKEFCVEIPKCCEGFSTSKNLK